MIRTLGEGLRAIEKAPIEILEYGYGASMYSPVMFLQSGQDVPLGRSRGHRMRLLNGTAAIIRIAFERIVDALEDHFFDFFADEREIDADLSARASDAPRTVGDDFGRSFGFDGGATDFGHDFPRITQFASVPNASFDIG